MGGDLSMDFYWYGRNASAVYWDSIDKGLGKTIDTLESDASSGKLPFISNGAVFSNDDVVIQFHWPLGQGIEPLSLIDAAKVVKKIQGLFFSYEDPPRELRAEIKIHWQLVSHIRLSWSPRMPDPWPKVPLDIPLPIPDLSMEIYLYGLEVPRVFNHKVISATERITYDLTRDLPAKGFISKVSYQNGFVRLDIQGPDEGDIQIAATMVMIRGAMYEIVDLFEEHLPRDLGACLLLRDRILARLFLTAVNVETFEWGNRSSNASQVRDFNSSKSICNPQTAPLEPEFILPFPTTQDQ